VGQSVDCSEGQNAGHAMGHGAGHGAARAHCADCGVVRCAGFGESVVLAVTSEWCTFYAAENRI